MSLKLKRFTVTKWYIYKLWIMNKISSERMFKMACNVEAWNSTTHYINTVETTVFCSKTFLCIKTWEFRVRAWEVKLFWVSSCISQCRMVNEFIVWFFNYFSILSTIIVTASCFERNIKRIYWIIQSI